MSAGRTRLCTIVESVWPPFSAHSGSHLGGFCMKVSTVTLIAGLLLIFSACATQTIDDAGMIAAIKSKYTLDGETSSLKIGVDAVNGVVTLSGTVPTEREKSKAEYLARNTTGVKQVVNNITVNPDSLGATNTDQK